MGVSCIRDILMKHNISSVLVERRYNAIDFYCVPADEPILEATLLSLTGSF